MGKKEKKTLIMSIDLEKKETDRSGRETIDATKGRIP
jgi:hypothetical protein